MLSHGYCLLSVKSVDDDQRIITGTASTPEPDRDEDVMDPKGAVFQLPMPLLWQHNQNEPIGHVIAADVTSKGISITAKLAKITEPGPLRDRLETAWQSLKSGLVRGLSVGYRGIDVTPIPKSFGFHFAKWAWLELSAVTIPANASATIQAVKSADSASFAASSLRARVSSTSGVPDSRKSNSMNVQEQIQARRAELKTKTARLEELMGKDTLTSEEQTEQDETAVDVKKLTGDVERLSTLQAAQATMTKAVGPVADPESASRARAQSGDPSIQVSDVKLPPGIAMARLLLCKMASFMAAQNQEYITPYEIAKSRFPDHTVLHLALKPKAAIAPALTTVSTWAGALVYAETITSDFLEYLRPMTILGKFGTNGIPSLRAVPFNSRLVGQDSGGTGYWVGQAKPKPLTKFDFSAQTVDFAKVAAIAVLAQELARFSSPQAETLARDGLAGALRQTLDTDFVDPATAAVSNVSPASITNGVVPLTPSGTNADAVRADVATLISEYIEANVDPTNLVIIMPNTLALVLSLMRSTLGVREFPDINMRGGFLEGIPVIASQFAANASGSGNLVIAVNARDVALADDGAISIDVSREASLEMKDSSFSQDGAVGTGTSLVSLWQNNLLGIKAERFITWKKLRSGAVAYMDDVAWGGAGSPS